MIKAYGLYPVYLFFTLFFFSPYKHHEPKSLVKESPDNEVIYHLFQRSFFDSNGDRIGDLKGIEQKLDYLQGLGINSILLLPLYESIYYHNYYSGDFKKIDTSFGSLKDYISLVKAIHKRGMKVYMDMETQYVTEDHLWYKSAVGNPKSPYSDYILFEDKAHTKPATFVLGLRGWTSYDGTYKKIATVNLKNKNVLAYNIKLYKYWLDPNGDGKFDDGVDGYRFDHMMDDLDNKPQLKGLFKSFWLPLITELKKVNPKIKNVAEQANWASWGDEYIRDGVADRIFSFKIMGAIRSFDKAKLTSITDSAFTIFPHNNQNVLFVENHDVPRFASSVNRSIPKLKIGASLNLLLGGTASIYYGQELGMYGTGAWGKWGMNDGNEIPMREAFEWYASDTGRGMALWYKNTGVWWDSTNLKPHDGISLEEQINDPNSLFNFYKKIISIRKTNPVIADGKFQSLENGNPHVYSFRRYDGSTSLLVVINLSDANQKAQLKDALLDEKKYKVKQLNGEATVNLTDNNTVFELKPYAIEIYSLKRK